MRTVVDCNVVMRRMTVYKPNNQVSMTVQLCLVLISQSVRTNRMQFYDLMLGNRQLTLQSPYLVRYELFAVIKN